MKLSPMRTFYLGESVQPLTTPLMITEDVTPNQSNRHTGCFSMHPWGNKKTWGLFFFPVQTLVLYPSCTLVHSREESLPQWLEGKAGIQAGWISNKTCGGGGSKCFLNLGNFPNVWLIRISNKSSLWPETGVQFKIPRGTETDTGL